MKTGSRLTKDTTRVSVGAACRIRDSAEKPGSGPRRMSADHAPSERRCGWLVNAMVRMLPWMLFGAVAIAADQMGVPPKIAAGLRTIRQQDLRADIQFLTADSLEGRRAMQRGADVAGEYVAVEFMKAGLKPLGSSYFQPVPLMEYRLDIEGTHAVLDHAGKKQRFEYFKDFSCEGPNPADVEARVVFAGYGITAPDYGYDDYAGTDVTGAIVIVFEHEPREDDERSIFNGLGNTPYASPRVKILNAQRHGAVGVLFVPEPNRKHPSSVERRKLVNGGVERMPVRASTTLGIADDTIRIPALTMRDHMLAAIMAASRQSASELQSAIEATLKPKLVALPDTRVRIHISIAEMRRGASSSVLGLLEGSDPNLKGETLIVSGHLDHGGMPDGKVHHGADDNASGSAGVMEIAHAFALSPERPRRSIIFVVWTAEEYPDLGSFYYSDHPLWPLEKTSAVLNMDMIGRNETPIKYTEGFIDVASDTSNEVNLIGVTNCPGCKEAIERQNKTAGLRLNYKWERDHTLNIFNRSDHFPFAMHHIPAIWFFTGFHPDYHQATDTIEKLNFVKMEKIVKLVYLTAWDLADSAQVPRFVSVPEGAHQ